MFSALLNRLDIIYIIRSRNYRYKLIVIIINTIKSTYKDLTNTKSLCEDCERFQLLFQEMFDSCSNRVNFSHRSEIFEKI